MSKRGCGKNVRHGSLIRVCPIRSVSKPPFENHTHAAHTDFLREAMLSSKPAAVVVPWPMTASTLFGGDGRGAFKRITPSQASRKVEVMTEATAKVVDQDNCEEEDGKDWQMVVDKVIAGVRRRISGAVWRLSCTIVRHRMKTACMDHTARSDFNPEQTLQKQSQ